MITIIGYVSAREAAEILGITVNTLNNWVAKGKVKAYRISVNNHRYFKEEDLDRIFTEITSVK